MKDILLKNLNQKDAWVFKKITSKLQISNADKEQGYLIDAEEKEVRKIIDTLKPLNKQIAVLAREDNFNRRMLETCKINYLVSVEGGYRKDTLKQRDSGLNHVLAKIAKQKNISIVINFSEISKTRQKQRAILLSRIMQNIKICRKAGCRLNMATFAEKKQELRNQHDLKSFAFSLGMSSQQVKWAFEL